jgi:hypothetical protein
MTTRTRQIALLLFAAALVAVLLLAASLSDVQLQAGGAFPCASGNGGAPSAVTGASDSGSSGSVVVIEAVLGVLVLVFLVYLPARLAGLLNLRNVLRLVGGLVLLVALLGLLPRVLPGAELPPPQEAPSAATPPSFAYPVSPLGQPPAGFRWLTAAGLVAGGVLLVVLILRRPQKAQAPADALRQEAEKALGELQAGGDFQNVIIRSYLQMMELLRAEQKLERRQSMTPREFEDWLESRGIPAQPLQRLTRLFETVRYGNERLTSQDEQAGRDCLVQITQYCRPGSNAE